MNNTTRRLARTLIAFAAFSSLSPSMCLHAADYINLSVSDQITGGSATGGSFLWNNNGRFIVSDSPLSNGVPGQGSNTMVWDSTNHRFLAGIWWTESSLGGVGSAAFGTFSSARGECSFAGGYLAQAYGFGSMAFGDYSTTNGSCAIALGSSVSNGDFATAIGGAWANGEASFATGFASALNFGSIAGGTGTAGGDYAVAFGNGTLANAFGCLAIGQFNLGTVSQTGTTAWVPTDPIFEIGIGQDSAHPSNAFTVYKNGTVIIPKAQGDILMGEFGN